MNPYHPPKSDRRVILLFLGILGILSLILLEYRQRPYSPIQQREQRYAALQDSYAQLKQQREQARLEREAAYQHRKDSFDQLKQQRDAARIKRELAYQHRKDSFEQLKQQRTAARLEREAAWQRHIDSLQALRPIKLQAGQTIDINLADSAQLVQVPGIGGARARAILRYREKLGGFYTPQQVLEIEEMPATVVPFLTINRPTISTLSLNTATIKQLVRHPYINYEQAKAILDYRRKYGKIANLQQLSLLDVFTPEDLERLSHYLQP